MSVRKRAWTTARGEQKTAWAVDYRDQGGKRRLKTFARKKEADAFAAESRVEIAQGIHTAASASPTVSQAAETWIEHGRAEGLERSTLEQRQRHIALHVAPFIGNLKLSDLTAPRVNAFLDDLRDNGRSLAMRRKVLTTLKTLLSFAQTRGMVAQNAARPVRVKSITREVGDALVLPTKAELRAIMENAPDRWRPLIVTAVFTGMRQSELRGLPWDGVDLDAGLIRVTQRADAWGQIGAPKSKAGRRTIPLAPMAVNALRQWRLACPEGGLVFPNGKGRVESHTNINNRVWRPLLRALGIVDDAGRPKYGMHALRHAAASLFIEQGWTPKKVQAVMGHSSIQVTFDIYGRLFADDDGDRKAVERMEAALLAG